MVTDFSPLIFTVPIPASPPIQSPLWQSGFFSADFLRTGWVPVLKACCPVVWPFCGVPTWHRSGALLKKAMTPSLPKCPRWGHCGVGKAQSLGLELCPGDCPEGWRGQRTALSLGNAFPLLSQCTNRKNEDRARGVAEKRHGNGGVTESNGICWQAQRWGEPSQNTPGCCTSAAWGTQHTMGSHSSETQSWIASLSLTRKVQVSLCSQAPTERLGTGMPRLLWNMDCRKAASTFSGCLNSQHLQQGLGTHKPWELDSLDQIWRCKLTNQHKNFWSFLYHEGKECLVTGFFWQMA